MDVKQAIHASLSQADAIVGGYLEDLTPAEMLARAAPNTNHVAWQLGHLIASEYYLVERVAPGSAAPLPDGFAARHKKDTAASDKAEDFFTKEEYLQIGRAMRAETLRIVDGMTDDDWDRPVEKVPPMVKTVGETLLFIGPHWLMHAGQWAIIRRTLGRAPLF